MNYLKIVTLLGVATMLNACSPGMKMDKNIYDEGTTDVILITPALVKKLNVNHESNPIYKVGRQDVLLVKVWGNEDLGVVNSKNANQKIDGLIVHNNGMIFYPYIGNVQVIGKSTEQIRLLLTQKLSKYITDPQISVSIGEYHSKRIHIMGEVQRPKTYAITNMPMSLLDATLLGGIDNTTADLQKIHVIRRTEKTNKPIVYQFNGESADTMPLAGQFYLKPNDVVFIAPAGVTSWNRVVSNILPSANLKASASK